MCRWLAKYVLCLSDERAAFRRVIWWMLRVFSSIYSGPSFTKWLFASLTLTSSFFSRNNLRAKKKKKDRRWWDWIRLLNNARVHIGQISLSYIAALRFWDGLKDFHPNWMVNYQTSLPAQQHRELVHLRFMDWLGLFLLSFAWLTHLNMWWWWWTFCNI